MKRLLIGSILAAGAAAAVVSACRGDPTASLRNGLSSIAVDPSLIFISEGDVRAVTATPQDDQLNPVSATVTAASQNSSVASVAENPDAPSVNGTVASFAVTAVAPGATTVDFSAGGVSASTVVNVLPLNFSGAISNATPPGGSEIVIHATDVLKFDPSLVTVRFGGLGLQADDKFAVDYAYRAMVNVRTPDSISVLVPFGATGKDTIDGIDVSYVANLRASLLTATSVDQTGRYWTGDDAYTTAPTIPLPAASGDTVSILTDLAGLASANSPICGEYAFGAIGPCAIYKFTLAAATELNFQALWDTNTDIDFYVCSGPDPSTCFEDGGGGATGNYPENTGATFPAGTHYLVLEDWDGPKPTNMLVIISRP